MSQSPKTMSELECLQQEGLRWALNHAYANCAFFRDKFHQAGVKPENIATPDDLTKLPFTTKEELRQAYPSGWWAVPPEQVVRIHASTGTTGRRIVAGYTAQDLTDWMDMFVRCYRMVGVGPRDRVQGTPGYGLWTAGIGFQQAAEAAGAMVIPTGPGNTELQLEFMVDFQTTVLTATSSFALLLGEEVQRRGLRERLALRLGIFGSERWGQHMRQRIEETLGLESYDIYGLTELYGPGMGIDCPAHQGIHFWSDYYLIEIVDPATGAILPPREEGEIVLTTLRKQAMPLVRYRSGDVARLLPGTCPCCSVFPRIDRLKGRTDDQIKFRGVIVYPAQFDHILAHTAGLSSEYQILLERQSGREGMLLRVEKQPDLNPALQDEVRSRLLAEIKGQLAITPEVELVAYQTLPRSERKTQRVIDQRDLG